MSIGHFENNIERYGLKLRLIEPDDAHFVLKLRTDPVLSRFLSKTDGSLKNQVDWIERYKERELLGEEYYFVVMNSQNESLGTTRLSELSGDCFELGSWLFSRDSPQGSSIIADVITKEIGFDTLGFDMCKFNVRKNNRSVLKYHLNFLPKVVDETDLDIFFTLSKENFNINKLKFLKFYNHGN